MPLQAEPQLYTPEAYLLREDDAEERSEYRDGEIVPMAGGTANHNRIAGEFYNLDSAGSLTERIIFLTS